MVDLCLQMSGEENYGRKPANGNGYPNSTTGYVAEYACEVEITDCEPLPDGHFFLEVESRRRCHILRNWDQDGFVRPDGFDKGFDGQVNTPADEAVNLLKNFGFKSFLLDLVSAL